MASNPASESPGRTSRGLKQPSVAAATSVHEGEMYTEDHGAESALRRHLATRHLIMVSIGSSIGMGLWLGSGTSLNHGGPASMFIGYCVAGSLCWATNMSIGEMAVLYPVPSAFVQWTAKFVDPSAAFAYGWASWVGSGIGLANELAGLVTVVGFWEGSEKLPTAAWLTIFLVLIILVNICAVQYFGEFEVVMSSIKFFWIFVVIISCTVISAGGAPNGDAIGFRYWKSEPFRSGFKGFLSVLSTCVFAMSGSESVGLAAAECGNPKDAVPKAVKSIFLRLSFFYILGSLMVSITVSPTDANLFGSGTNASPFVLAYRNSGLVTMAHIMNAVILLSVFSSGSFGGYGGARTPIGLANLSMAPKIYASADKSGRPWAGLITVFILGGGLCYLNVSESGSTVFGWLSNLSSLFTLFNWALINLSHIRMRQAWKKQGRSTEELPWTSGTYPWSAWWGVGCCVVVMIIEFYLSVWPLGESSSAENFFANYVSVILIIALWLGARLYYRGPWLVPLESIVLDAGRRFYVDVQDEEKRTPPSGKSMGRGLVKFLTTSGGF